MIRKLVTVLCFISMPCSFAGEKISSPDKHQNDSEAPGGFWGVFSAIPTPQNMPAGSNELADKLQVSPAEIELRPLGKPPQSQQADRMINWLDAIHVAVNRHPSIISSVASLESTGFGVEAANAGYLPNISAGVTSGRQEDKGTGQIATLGLSQMLYDFGKTGSMVDLASAKFLRQQASVLEQVDSIIQQTALALNEVYRYAQLVENARLQVASLRDILKLTQMRAQAGASSRIDPVQAQARVEAAEAQQQEMEIKLQQERFLLQSLLGQSVVEAQLSAPQDLLPLIQREGERVDLNKNPTVLVAQADAVIAKAELRSYKAQRYPTLSLEASSNKYVGNIADYQTRSQYNNVYLSLNSSIYQGGALVAQENASAKALEAARTTIDSKKIQLTDQQRSYYHNILGLQRNIKILKKRMETITETRALYREQYLSLGNRNALDLLNAEQEISRAQLDLINAACDLWASELNYVVLSGMARDVFNLNNKIIHGLRIAP
ncbi:adhesin transport system outer membrane protein [Gibbsiella quercinecans]|nr:adhesin transport system outer membrane protein [Gibbsiella quercinecans]